MGENKGKYRLCKVCNKPIWCQPRKTHEYCSKQCKNLAVTIYSWKRNSTMPYTGKKKYYGPNWLMQRRRARKRDQYKCQICGIHEKEYGQELSVHHKKPFVYFESYEKLIDFKILFLFVNHAIGRYIKGSNILLRFA